MAQPREEVAYMRRLGRELPEGLGRLRLPELMALCSTRTQLDRILKAMPRECRLPNKTIGEIIELWAGMPRRSGSHGTLSDEMITLLLYWDKLLGAARYPHIASFYSDLLDEHVEDKSLQAGTCIGFANHRGDVSWRLEVRCDFLSLALPARCFLYRGIVLFEVDISRLMLDEDLYRALLELATNETNGVVLQGTKKCRGESLRQMIHSKRIILITCPLVEMGLDHSVFSPLDSLGSGGQSFDQRLVEGLNHLFEQRRLPFSNVGCHPTN